MVKVRIPGYNRQEGYKVFEILDRGEIEKILEELDPAEIWYMTYNEGNNWDFSGIAYTYLDARDGKVYSAWLQQNTMEHPWDSFYQIILCTMETGDNWWDFMVPDELLDWDEQREFLDYDGTLKEFIIEKYGEEELQDRIENAKDYWAYEFNFDWNDINEQLNYLYSFTIED